MLISHKKTIMCSSRTTSPMADSRRPFGAPLFPTYAPHPGQVLKKLKKRPLIRYQLILCLLEIFLHKTIKAPFSRRQHRQSVGVSRWRWTLTISILLSCSLFYFVQRKDMSAKSKDLASSSYRVR